MQFITPAADQEKNDEGFDAVFSRYDTDKTTHHTYGYVYDQLYPTLESRRAVRRVLEIGVYRGGSLRGWREWFPKAEIHGLDNNPEYIFDGEDRIFTALVDSNDAKLLNRYAKVYGPFDLIVDDGPHDPRSQITALLTLWQYVKPGGYYCIEDILADKYYNLMNYYSYFPGTLQDFRHISNIRNDIILTLPKAKEDNG